MRKHKRLPILVMIALAVVAVTTAGVANAAWVWCDDPVVSVGNDDLGYTTMYIVFAADDEGSDGELVGLSPSLTVNVPEGINASIIDPQGWIVDSGTDAALKIKQNHIQTGLDILVTSASENETRIKVRVTLDPNGKNVIGTAVGSVGEVIHLDVNVPAGSKPGSRN